MTRILLRHARTGHFYNGALEWVLSDADARSFGTVEEALEIVARDKLDGMTLVIRYERGGEQQFDLQPPSAAKPGQAKKNPETAQD